MKNKKFLNFTVETKSLGENEIELIVASDKEDRHGERLSIEGLSISKYKENPIVLWAHEYSEAPIGRATKVWKEAGKLMAKVLFAVEENPKAKMIYDLIKGNFLNAASIGFIANYEDMVGNMFTKSEMVEFSIVPVPANPEALILGRKLGLDNENLKSYTYTHMNELEKILAKEVSELTLKEIKLLKESLNDMTPNQIKKFSSVLKEQEVEETEEEKVARELKEKEEADKLAAGEKTIKELQDKVTKLEAEDKIVIKNIHVTKTVKDEVKVDAKMKFLHYVKGLQSGNMTQYKELLTKDALNTSDDAVLLPPVEFIAEVERLEEEYGVAEKFATVRKSSNGSGIKFLLGDDDLEIFDTAESGVKKSTKLSYAEKTLLWRKFAGILPITDELSEDSAINLWNDATARFARAYSRKADYLVFSETSATTPKNKGITQVSGTNVVTVASLAAIAYADLVDMVYGVPSASGDNGRFYLNRTMLGQIMKMKDDENRPLWLAGVQSGAPATILNRPYTLTEELSNVDSADAGDAIIVYGDLRYVTLGMRTGLNIKIFDSGSVGDPDDVDQSDQINLLTQDVQAMRAVKRMNAVVRFPAAFSVMKLAAGS